MKITLLFIICLFQISSALAEPTAIDWQAKRDAAFTYISVLDKEVARLVNMKEPPSGRAEYLQSKQMDDLQHEGDQFGLQFAYGNLPESPIFQCRTAGIYAKQVWQTRPGYGIYGLTPYAALNQYLEASKNCHQQLDQLRRAKK